MAILSLVVMNRMNSRLEEFDRAQVKAGRAQEMLYAVTAESHYRAMALLTEATMWNDRVGEQKARFAGLLEDMEQDEPDESEFVQRLIADNERYEESASGVLALFEAGNIDGAIDLHVQQEHDISHDLEDSLNEAHPAGQGRHEDRGQ